MRVERARESIVVSLSAEEVYSVQAGRTIGDRPSIISPDSKVEVAPLSAIKQDDSLKDMWALDRLRKGLEAPLKGYLYPNGDLQIFVPAIKLSDVRIGQANLPRQSIETPMSEDREGYLSKAIPDKGVIVRFGGSLRAVDVNAHFY